jgi:hypothetical protein
MSGQSHWWAISGALLVLIGVLVLADSPRQPPKEMDPEVASQPEVSDPCRSDVIMARDASGQLQPLAFEPADTAQALVLVFPAHFAGKNVDVTLWRRLDNQREAEPWIRMRPLVRSDATLPMAGIVPGQYDIQVGLPDELQLLVEAAPAPGEVIFVVATPVR